MTRTGAPAGTTGDPTRACSCAPSAIARYQKRISEPAAQRLQLSARAFHRVLKLARTIADLAEAETIAAPHLAETLHYRPQVDVG
ncbi:MAG TPA: ATP-binding protein [Ktedonobacterales bacterium]|nr:ATP-binding protein [Ktedonobacterales bacterium]